MNSERVCSLVLTVTVWLASAAWAAPQFGGGTGQYQILQARYGTANRNVDVTDRLRVLANQNRPIRASNSTFGVDPDPGRRKVLRIYSRGPNGRNQMFEFPEGSTVDGTMFTGWRTGNWGHGGWNGGWNGDAGQYQILQARYGTANRNIDVTNQLRALATQNRPIRAGNSTFGTDPDPGRPKVLRIYTRGPNGLNRTFQFAEGSVVDGAMFTGWRTGNWGRGGWNGGWGI